MVTQFGRPDLFITFTCNPKSREIVENLLPQYNSSNTFIYRVDMDWKQARIPELEGTQLRKNQQITLNGMKLNYGINIIE